MVVVSKIESTIVEGYSRNLQPNNVSLYNEPINDAIKDATYQKQYTFDKTLGFPNKTHPYLALVKATFKRRGSFKNPIP